MQHIFVYGDSLSWGIVPNTRERLPFDQRWPGVLERELNSTRTQPVRVTEDCLNGRRTVWEDPFKPGRNGLQGLAQKIESQSPLSLVILMLGTNDFQFSQPFNEAWSAALGIAALVNEIRRAPIEPGMPVPPVLIVAPPPPKNPQGMFGAKFTGAEGRAQGLAAAYRNVAEELNCPFFDAGQIISVSPADGVHVDADAQRVLGKALTGVVNRIL